MAAVLADDLEVCTDCAMMSANGELGQGDESAERAHAERMAARYPVGRLVLTGEGDDGGVVPFSRRACDGCGDELAGERHPAAVLS